MKIALTACWLVVMAGCDGTGPTAQPPGALPPAPEAALGPTDPSGPTGPVAPPPAHLLQVSVPIPLALRATGAMLTVTRLSRDRPAVERTLVTGPGASEALLEASTAETVAITIADVSGRIIRSEMMDAGQPSWPSDPRIIAVPDDVATIQGAIDVARPGDTVWVGPGRYTEHVHLRTGVRLIGAGPKDTVLDASGDPSASEGVFSQGAQRSLIDFSEAHDVVISGFTLRGVKRGAGCADQADALLCGGDWYPAALYADGHQDDVVAWLHPELATSALITQNVFEDNEIALMLYFHAHAVVRSNLFVRNVNAVVANHFQDTTLIANNVFYGSTRLAVGSAGATIDILNNIFANTGTDIVADYQQGGRTRCNLFSRGGSVVATADGNFMGDPQFADPANLDFTLLAGSTAVDTGCFAGDATDPDGTREDMGAFGGPMAAWNPL